MAGGPDLVRTRWSLRDAGWVVLLAAAYFAAGRFGLSLAFVNSSASAVWPATGIAIGALVVLGLRFWPAVLLGAFATNLDNSLGHASTTTAVLSSGLISLGNTLEAYLGAWAALRLVRGPRAFEAPATVFGFYGLAGVAAPMVAASVGVVTLLAFGLAQPIAAGDIWITWWLGDAVGAIVLAPVIILAMPRHGKPRLRPGWEAELALVIALLLAAIVFGPWGPKVFVGRPYAFTIFPPLVWTAVRLGPLRTAVTGLLVDAIAVAGTLNGHGPFVLASTNESLIYLQAFIGVVAVVTLPTAALGQQQALARRQVQEAANRLGDEVDERTAELRKAADDLRAQTEELRQSRTALRRALDTVDLAERATRRGSWEWDTDKDRAVWSDGMYRLFGLDPARFQNSNDNFLALVHPDDRARMGQAIADALARPGPFLQEYRLRRPDGAELHIHGEGNVITDAEGRPRRLVGFVQDVTEMRALETARQQAERAVHDSELRLRKIFATTPAGIILTRRDGSVIDVNEAAERLWGLKREQFLDPAFRTTRLFIDPAEREPIAAGIAKEGRARNLEIRMRRGDGAERRILFNVEVVQLGGETVFVSAGQDITELREAEAKVRESESRLRAVLDNANDAIITGDATASIVDWNRAAERIFGYSLDEALGKSIADLMPREQWAEYQADIAQFMQGKPSRYVGRSRDMHGLRKDGGAIDIELSLGVWQSATGPMFTGVVRDITKRKAAQVALERATHRFESVFRSSPVAIALTKEDGRFVDVNEAYCRLAGREREALLSGDVRAQDVWDDPEERQRMLLAIRQHGVVRDLELVVRRPDGEMRTALASVEYLDLGGDTTILSLLQDITDRKRLQEAREAHIASEAELERLRRTDRFRTDFINNIAHELATPLTPLVLKSRTLANDASLSQQQRQHVEAIERNVLRLRNVVDEMVGAADLQARTMALERRRLNLTRELRAAVAAQQPAAERAGITMDEPEDSGATVSADAARLQLVLGHLIGNAIKFTPRGGRVTVGAHRIDADHVRIEVADTGIGLTRKQMEGLWRPFAQAHDKSQRTDSGSGLGLYVSKGIVELHGGEVGVRSDGPGKGATFWFTLPLATGHVDPLARAFKDEAAPSEHRRDLNPGAYPERAPA